MNGLSAEVALWAATIVVEDMQDHEVASHHQNSRQTAVSHYKAKLEMCGVKPLKKAQVLALWKRLMVMPFVRSANLPYMRKSDKVDAWKRHVQDCLEMEGAKQLGKGSNAAGNAATATPPGHVPPVASLPYASMPAPYPHAASVPPSHPPHNRYSFASPYGGAYSGSSAPPFMGGSPNRGIHDLQRMVQQHRQQQQQRQQLQQLGQQASFHSPPHAMAAAASARNYGGPYTHGGTLGSGGESRKRKTPGMPTRMDADFGMGLPGSEADRFYDAMMGSLRGNPPSEGDLFDDFMNEFSGGHPRRVSGGAGGPQSAAAAANPSQGTNTNDPGESLTPVETRIMGQLQQMGFTDKKEMIDAIRRAVEKAGDGDAPTSEEVMLDIVTAREEADEAKKMDEARKRSEQTNQEESQRLRDKRKQDSQQLVLDATFEQLRNPTGAENHKLMFPESWLLRYEECVNLLTDVANEKKYLEAKKVLIEILKLEKNCKKWYKAGELPKYYFTFEVGKRLLTGNEAGDPQALCQAMQKILDEGNQGILICTEDIPPILQKAKDEYQDDSQAAGQDTGDDDDEIILMTKEEVEQMQARKPAASSAGLGTAGPVISCD